MFQEGIENQRQIIRGLLLDTFLTGFAFGCGFTLGFHREVQGEIQGKKYPMDIKLDILSDWWFGLREDWKRKVESMTKGIDLVEPEEPVLSFELARLRWSEGAVIKDVIFKEDHMTLLFECGDTISISYYDEMDSAWIISDCNESNPNDGWSVCCEDGVFYVRIPG